MDINHKGCWTFIKCLILSYQPIYRSCFSLPPQTLLWHWFLLGYLTNGAQNSGDYYSKGGGRENQVSLAPGTHDRMPSYFKTLLIPRVHVVLSGVDIFAVDFVVSLCTFLSSISATVKKSSCLTSNRINTQMHKWQVTGTSHFMLIQTFNSSVSLKVFFL